MSLTTSTLAGNGRQLGYNGKLVSILLTPSRQVSLKLVRIFCFVCVVAAQSCPCVPAMSSDAVAEKKNPNEELKDESGGADGSTHQQRIDDTVEGNDDDVVITAGNMNNNDMVKMDDTKVKEKDKKKRKHTGVTFRKSGHTPTAEELQLEREIKEMELERELARKKRRLFELKNLKNKDEIDSIIDENEKEEEEKVEVVMCGLFFVLFVFLFCFRLLFIFLFFLSIFSLSIFHFFFFFFHGR